MKHIDLSKKAWQWATLIFLSFIWGSSFILMKKGLESYSNIQVAAFRILFASLVLLPFSLKNLKKIHKKNLFPLLVVGFIGSAIPTAFFTTAQMHITSSLAGMLNSLTPFFTLVVGMTVYRTRFKSHNMLGIFLGLIGALVLLGINPVNVVYSINHYALLVVAATLCYGINTNEVKNRLPGMTSLEITSLAFLFIGPVALIFLLFSDFSSALATSDYGLNLFYLFLLASLGTAYALWVFNTLIQHTTSVFAASVTYIIPVFAILWGIFDGELVQPGQYLGISAILFGVYLVNKK
ncbi:MAG: DMT family transporter [Bacteroidota bacterium]